MRYLSSLALIFVFCISIFADDSLPITISIDKPTGIDSIAQLESQNGESFKFAQLVPVQIDILEEATSYVQNNKTFYLLKIDALDAKGLSLYFDKFWIPSSGQLMIYNEDKSEVFGPFTSSDNHESGVYALPIINNDHIIIEYVQSVNEGSDPLLFIDKVAYAYKSIGGQLGGYNDSEYCQVNANCSEGNQWQNQKKSVCRIQIQDGWSVGLCTGALINTTSGNCAPYVLSADHCFDGGDISANSLNQCIFYFNYLSNNCNNSVPNNVESITGCELLSNSGNQGDNGDSDFFLVELNSDPDFDPYFSGWDRSSSPASSGVSIHHPSGDIMKISTFTSSLSSAGGLGFGGNNNTHWRVYWSETNNGHGVTEGGSSGSPIFNSNGLIVGDLTGGSSYCNATGQPDIYGKISYSWDQMGNNASKQLKPWLDPNNSGAMSVQGAYCNSSAVSAGFSTSNNNLCVGENAIFSSNASGNITSYSWEFPGGFPATANGPGPHNISYSLGGIFDATLTVYGEDGNSDTYSVNNYISVGQNQVDLDFLPDCYGIETSWNLQNSNGQTLYSVSEGYYPGGETAEDMEPNPTIITENWCLVNGCYDFNVFDDYGDGLYGSQHSCEFDGDFTIYGSDGSVLAELTSSNSDFGSSITVDFCVNSTTIPESYNCINESCVDPLDGSGSFNSIQSCIASCHSTSSVENYLASFESYPNPFQNVFYIESEKMGQIDVFNVLSQSVFSGYKNTDRITVDLIGQPSGLYIVKFGDLFQKLHKK